MRCNTIESLRLSRRYLDLIGGQPMSLAEKQAFIAETVEAYEKHVNRGFISYRKVGHRSRASSRHSSGPVTARCCRTCSEASTSTVSAATASSAPASIIRASSRRCRTRWGAWRSTVRNCSSPGVPDWRACWRRLRRGSSAAAFSSTTAPMPIEGAIKLARLYTKRNTFLSTLGGFHGKSLGSLSLMGKASFREPFLGGSAGCALRPLR